jgi:hypothetical protein
MSDYWDSSLDSNIGQIELWHILMLYAFFDIKCHMKTNDAYDIKYAIRKYGWSWCWTNCLDLDYRTRCSDQLFKMKKNEKQVEIVFWVGISKLIHVWRKKSNFETIKNKKNKLQFTYVRLKKRFINVSFHVTKCSERTNQSPQNLLFTKWVMAWHVFRRTLLV